MIDIELTDQQVQVKKDVLEWYQYSGKPDYKVRRNHKTIAGFAGTGKTLLTTLIIDDILKANNGRIRIACVAYTGKAASVLQNKLEDYGLAHKVSFIGTIHGLMYSPIFEIDPKTRKKVIKAWKRRETLEEDLIIIDEASMVSLGIWQGLQDYKIPILAVGDNVQLPPVDDANKRWNLMDKASFKLTEIHRQEADNPIINLSIQARTTGSIKHGIYSPEVFKLSWKDPRCQEMFKGIEFDDETIALCGLNKTRADLNYVIRTAKDFTKRFPYPGERLVCLKNNRNSKVMNGQLGTMLWLVPRNEDLYSITVQMDDHKHKDLVVDTLVPKEVFGRVKYDNIWELQQSRKFREMSQMGTIDFFDYGYALSVHKAQGSEWDRVVLFEERAFAWDDEFWKRWLYTAVTRAKKKLFIITDY